MINDTIGNSRGQITWSLQYKFTRTKEDLEGEYIFEPEETYQLNGIFGTYLDKDSNLSLKNYVRQLEKYEHLKIISYIKDLLYILG